MRTKLFHLSLEISVMQTRIFGRMECTSRNKRNLEHLEEYKGKLLIITYVFWINYVNFGDHISEFYLSK